MENLSLSSIEFESAYNSYHPVMSKVAYYKVGNRYDAEDICQELFLKLYKNMDNIENMKKWLNAVLRNMLADFYNNNKIREEAFDDYVLSDMINHSSTDDLTEIGMIMDDIIENEDVFYDDIDKGIFSYILEDDLTNKEIGFKYGLTKRQVQYRVKRIECRIMDHFKKRGLREFGELM